jgi:HK97 gp10 family phage protein
MATKLIGRERALAKLARIPAAVRRKIRPTIEAEAAEIVGMQKRLVAVESGELRDSIRYEMGDTFLDSSANLAATGGVKTKGSSFRGSGGGLIKGDPDLTATIIAGDRDAWYARFVEFGTKRHRIAPRKRGESLSIEGNVLAPNRAVWHPGAKSRPFFYGPFRGRRSKAKRAIARAFRAAIRAVAKS